MESNIQHDNQNPENQESLVEKYPEEEEDENKFYKRCSLDNLEPIYLKIMKANQYYILHLSRKASNFKQFNLLKFHLIFDKTLPKIFIIPILRTFALRLHMNCQICKNWLEEYIEDGNDEGENKQIIINNNHIEKNGIIILQYPQIQKLYYYCPSSNDNYKPWLLKYYSVNIFENAKGNVHACVSLKKTDENKKEKHFLDLRNQILDNLISINSKDMDLLDRLGLLLSFTDRLID